MSREPDASGRAATFVCGVSVEFDLCIDEEAGAIVESAFRTNGCGFTVVAADLISRSLTGVRFVELHALTDIKALIRDTLGVLPAGRRHCHEICFQGLQNALEDLRKKKADSWNGEDALICSCFGVSESTIESIVSAGNLQEVEQVGEVCGAGTGCGSCQPLIREIIDLEAGN